MIFGKVFDKIVGGWADAYRVAKCSANCGRSVLTNSHGQVLDFWEGMSWWWVETYELSVERDTAKSMEDLFGNSNSSSCVDSDSITFKSGPNHVASVPINGGLNIGTLTLTPADQITGISASEWLDDIKYSTLRVNAPKATGRWDFERVSLETTNPPHPIRRTLISLLTGAKWTPYSPKHATKYYGYLRLMPNPAHLTHRNPSIC